MDNEERTHSDGVYVFSGLRVRWTRGAELSGELHWIFFAALQNDDFIPRIDEFSFFLRGFRLL